MKTSIITKLTAVAVCTTVLSSSAFAAEMSSDDNKLYFGVEGGYSVPAKDKFTQKIAGVKVVGTLKGTGVYEGKVGYKVYPGIALELAYAHRPKYTLDISFADQKNVFGEAGGIKNITSKTGVQSHTVMLNLMYEAQTQQSYRPYFLVGMGYAHVTPKKSPINGDIPTIVAMNPKGPFNGKTRPQIGNIRKVTSQKLGWRIGAGMVYDVTPNIALVGGAKLEVIHDIGLHTEWSNNTKNKIKQSIGVVDFTIGTRISL